MNDALRKKIDAYVEGKLNPEEVRLFENEIKLNSELKEEISLSKEILNYLSNSKEDDLEIPDNEYHQKLRSFFNSDEAKTLENTLLKVRQEYHKKRKPNRKNYRAIAAVLILLIVSTIGYLTFNRTSKETLFDQYYSNKDLPSTIQRNNEQTDFTKGVIKFEQKEYANALVYFEKYKSQTKKYNTALLLYTGVTNMQLGEYEAALTDFDSVISSGSIDYSKGLWFKALTYIKVKDIENAKITLNVVLEKQSNFKFKEAQELLPKLVK